MPFAEDVPAPLPRPGEFSRLNCSSGGGSRFPQVRRGSGPRWLGPKPWLVRSQVSFLLLPQHSERSPHSSQTLPPEHEPGLPQLWMPLWDLHSAEISPPDLPVHRQRQGRRCPQEQDQSSRLRPPAPAFPAGDPPCPDCGVLPGADIRSPSLPGAIESPPGSLGFRCGGSIEQSGECPIGACGIRELRTQGGLRQSCRDLPGCPQGRQKNPRSSQAHDRN